MTDTTIVIPSIPPRAKLLCGRAIPSALAQTVPPADVIVALDRDKEGAGPTRTRALAKVTTPWAAFLDDDDELLPHHLEHLHHIQQATDADVVTPWFQVVEGTDPFPEFNRPWNPDDFHIFPITCLVRTDIAQRHTFPPPEPGHPFSNEDDAYWRAVNTSGAKIVHTPEITWRWYHNTGNTSGRPERW